MNAQQKAAEQLRLYAMTAPGDAVAVALSGGADSMSLLHILLSLKRELSLREVFAVHLNHRLRGEESARDEAFVQRECARLGVRLICGCADIPSIMARQKTGAEQTARQVRYNFLQRIAMQNAPCRIATAHNADDQTETMLLHMTRGCGWHGLTGIPPVRGHIIRPLLTCSRADIEQYCSEHAIPYITDSTNADERYSRNALRARVVPVLRQINPQADAAFGRLAQQMRTVDEWIESMSEEVLERAALPNGWDTAVLSAQPTAVKQTALRKIGGTTDVFEEHIAAMADLLKAPGSVTLPGGKTVISDGERLYFQPVTPPSIAPFSVFPNGCYDFCGKEVHLSLVFLDKTEKIPFVHKNLLKNSLDYDKINGKLFLRQRQDGDAYHPVGRGGKTLKKLFQEAGIAVEDRQCVPVLCDDDGILLVDGFGCDRRASVTESTRVILRMECFLA